MSLTHGGNQASSAPVTAGLPADAAGRDALAAEYVVGVLDHATAQRVAAAMQMEEGWREAVAAWEARLGALALLARPEMPPANLWDRVEARIAPPEVPRERTRRRLGWAWRGWAILATLAALGVAGWTFYPRKPPPRLLAVMVNDRNLPGLLAEVDHAGNLHLTIVPAATGRIMQSPAGRSFQVWAFVPGAKVPSSVGVMPDEPGKQVVMSGAKVRFAPEVLLEVSIEPEGGAPNGLPSGPVVFIGRLASAAPGV